MQEGYFVYNNIKYPTGTVVAIKEIYQHKIRMATFIYHDTNRDTYVFKYRDNGQQWIVSSKDFFNNLQYVTDKFDSSAKIPQRKQLKDRHINSLIIGWVWYIFLMAIFSIFNGRFAAWIILSVCFFKWRKNKIEKEGYYVER
jgi:hypothetical protein